MVVQFKSFAIRLSLGLLPCAVILLSLVSMADGQTEERIFENAIPKHAPIKVQIKKEKEQSFKDLANDEWVREFELEATNIGDKPMYYLAFVLETNLDGGHVLVPDSVREGRLGFDVRYGRDEFGDIITKAGLTMCPSNQAKLIRSRLTAARSDLGRRVQVRESTYKPPKSN